MVGKPLSALLQILRSQGATKWQRTVVKAPDGTETETVSVELAPGPTRAAATLSRSISLSPEALAAEQEAADDDAPPDDFRFALERRVRRHFPPAKADPRQNKAPQ